MLGVQTVCKARDYRGTVAEFHWLTVAVLNTLSLLLHFPSKVYGDLESLEKLSSKLFAEEETMRERKEKKGTSVFPSSVPSIH